VRRLGPRIERDPSAHVAQALLAVFRRRVDERIEDRHVKRTNGLAMGLQPLPEPHAIGELRSVEQLTAKGVCGTTEYIGRRVLDSGRQHALHLVEIELTLLQLEPHVLAIGGETAAAAVRHERSQLRQAPTERRPRIVWNLPEHLAEPRAGQRSPLDRKMAEEGARFLRRGQHLRPAVEGDRELAEHVDP
jgi:hypothetical protein